MSHLPISFHEQIGQRTVRERLTPMILGARKCVVARAYFTELILETSEYATKKICDKISNEMKKRLLKNE